MRSKPKKKDKYANFIDSKSHKMHMHGFEPMFMPNCLKDFQKALVDWSVRKGRAAIFADCGLGKTLMQLVWAQNIVEKTNGKVLILTPLAVGAQTVKEAERFNIEAHRSQKGDVTSNIIVTNYERLHHFDSKDFVGCVCDESSILKNYDGKYKTQITEFMKKMSYRLLCTATAAPNDYIELGTSSEALGELGFVDMLGRWFKNDTNPTVTTKRKFARQGGAVPKWRFKWHAEWPFWKWVTSWAKAVRRPSDMGFKDGKFSLPKLIEQDHILNTSRRSSLSPALTFFEQRQERRDTINERCEKAVDLATKHERSILWCHLNDEGNLIESMLPDCVQVCGSQSDEKKEEMLLAFLSGEAKYLVTKPMCAGFGLNMQHCNHMTFFPTHSYEQYYQSVRRCWRFGQKNQVTVDIVTTKGESAVLSNLQKKSANASAMFDKLITCMNDGESLKKYNPYTKKERLPKWL